MTRLLLLAALTLMAAPALAETRDCAWLVRHVPDADVAYRPGVDVHGKPVAPADLAPAPSVLPDNRVMLDLSLPLRLFRGGPSRRVDEADVLVGVAEFDLATGEVRVNGQSLNGPDTAALVAWCRGRLKGTRGGPPLPAHKPAPK